MFIFLPEHCQSCAPGTYQNQSGASSCINCDPGFFSAQGMSACSRCEPEEYSLSDGSGCVTCADSTECPCMEVATLPCISQDNCYNLGSTAYTCGPCPDGYEGDGVTCTDIDEVYSWNIDYCKNSKNLGHLK